MNTRRGIAGLHTYLHCYECASSAVGHDIRSREGDETEKRTEEEPPENKPAARGAGSLRANLPHASCGRTFETGLTVEHRPGAEANMKPHQSALPCPLKTPRTDLKPPLAGCATTSTREAQTKPDSTSASLPPCALETCALCGRVLRAPFARGELAYGGESAPGLWTKLVVDKTGCDESGADSFISEF